MGTNMHDLIAAARGMQPADLVLHNARIFNPFTCSWETGNLAIKEGIVLGTGDYFGTTEIDLDGRHVIPGLIDAHVHIESSLLTPREYARLVVRHGTTTVIADPHEIANVAGTAGLEFMLAERQEAAINDDGGLHAAPAPLCNKCFPLNPNLLRHSSEKRVS